MKFQICSFHVWKIYSISLFCGRRIRPWLASRAEKKQTQNFVCPDLFPDSKSHVANHTTCFRCEICGTKFARVTRYAFSVGSHGMGGDRAKNREPKPTGFLQITYLRDQSCAQPEMSQRRLMSQDKIEWQTHLEVLNLLPCLGLLGKGYTNIREQILIFINSAVFLEE